MLRQETIRKKSGRFHNGTRADATGTGIDSYRPPAVGYGADFLQVGQPAAAILIMGMTDVISGSRFLPTNLTYTGHNIFSPSKGLLLRFTESYIIIFK